MRESDAIHGIISSLGYQAGNYVYEADNSTAEARTDTNLRGRQSALRMLRFIRSLPGGENAHAFLARYDEAIARIAAAGHDSAMAVSHGAALRTWVSERVRGLGNEMAERRAANPANLFDALKRGERIAWLEQIAVTIDGSMVVYRVLPP